MTNIRAKHHEHERAQDENGAKPRQLQNIADDGAVLSAARIVVIAIQENLIADIANPVLRGLHESEPQILGREFDSIEVSRNVAVRCEHHNRSGVRVLLGLRIELILKSD